MQITEKALQAVVDRINRITCSPTEMFVKSEAGRCVTRIGHYHLSHAYGGVSLCRIDNEAGGTEDVFNRGHMPKRALYDLMHAFIKGFTVSNEAQQANSIGVANALLSVITGSTRVMGVDSCGKEYCHIRKESVDKVQAILAEKRNNHGEN